MLLMMAKLLWIVFVLNLYAYGKVLVDQINPQIVCDHRLTEDNKTLNNRTDLPIDTQYQQIQCQAQNCNFSSYLEFDVQNYNQFCISSRILTNDGQLYKLEYVLGRLHSTMSSPFYIYMEFQPISSMEPDVHCQYQQPSEQKIRLRIQACNCSEKSLPPLLSLCPQSTISTDSRIRTTDHTSIIVNQDDNTGKLSTSVIATITVALSLGICGVIAVFIYLAMKCRKGKVSTNITETQLNNATNPASIEEASYISSRNERNSTTSNSNNNDNVVSQRESASNDVELHHRNDQTRNDNNKHEMDNRICGKKLTVRDRHQAAPTGQYTQQPSHSTNYIPEHISKMMLEINTSFESTDHETQSWISV